MIRFLAYAAGVITMLLIACAAMAGPKKGSSNSHHHGKFDKFHGHHDKFGFDRPKFARSFGHGVYFPGKSHKHWTYSGYSAKYGCTVYWCPSTTSYYYWCQSAGCYYPVSYIRHAPPDHVPHQFGRPSGSPPPGVPSLP
jgi:hypothetical protein